MMKKLFIFLWGVLYYVCGQFLITNWNTSRMLRDWDVLFFVVSGVFVLVSSIVIVVYWIIPTIDKGWNE